MEVCLVGSKDFFWVRDKKVTVREFPFFGA